MKAVIYRNALKAASRFQAVKDTRFYLCGILLESSPLESRMVATDGHILVVTKCHAKDDNEGIFSGIIPSDVVKTILAWKGPGKNANHIPVTISGEGPEYRAEWCGNVALFKLVDGKFPDYARVIPDKTTGETAFYDADLLVRVKRASEDMGNTKGLFSINYNGNSGGLIYINSETVAVIMPMRNDGIADAGIETGWSREALPGMNNVIAIAA